MGRRGSGERDAVESRKLKVERQPKKRRIQRSEKLRAGAGARTRPPRGSPIKAEAG